LHLVEEYSLSDKFVDHELAFVVQSKESGNL